LPIPSGCRENVPGSYEASLRKSGLTEAEISPLLRKARQTYDDLIEGEADDVEDVDWKDLEAAITETNFGHEDTHFKAAALHYVRQLNRCLAALKTGLH
jgi:hypothetical protein